MSSERITTRVKGISHYQDAAGQCREGDEVLLVADPDNRYDSNAVRVEHEGNLIGHLDRTLAAAMAGAVKGGRVTAHVEAVLGGTGGYLTGVSLELVVIQPPAPVAELKSSMVEPLLDVFDGDGLGNHEIDDAVKLGAAMERLRQKILQLKYGESDQRSLGIVARDVATTMCEGIIPGHECPDVLRTCGIAAVIMNDRSLGVFVHCGLRRMYQGHNELPHSIIRLLSLLAVKFEADSHDIGAYQAALQAIEDMDRLPTTHPRCLEVARMYFDGRGVPRDRAVASQYYGRFAEAGGSSELFELALAISRQQTEFDAELEPLIWSVLIDQGDVTAMYNLGNCYANGRGVEQDDSRAVSWYLKAAEGGQVTAMFNLGVCYANGRGVEQDESQAVSWFVKAAEGGDVDAMFNLGIRYANGRGVEQDYSKAVSWYLKAAQGGQMDAMWNLGVCHAYGRGVEQDESQAVSWYLKAAQGGQMNAMCNLGNCYANGRGVEQDESQAVSWYLKAAEGGDVDAMFNLGIRYANGRGVEQDDSKAVSWYLKAAEGGQVTAMFNLGVCYANGRGVEQDDSKAVSWYLKAAEGGQVTAMFNLGVCYANGRGVEQDDSKAVSWYLKAAEGGQVTAMFNLGVCYANGRGVEQDDSKAVSWFVKAAEKGDRKAKEELLAREQARKLKAEKAKERKARRQEERREKEREEKKEAILDFLGQASGVIIGGLFYLGLAYLIGWYFDWW